MDNEVRQRIRRLYAVIIVAFLGLVGWQSYWQLAKSDWLLSQPGNRRLSRAELAVPRGMIFDRAGQKLAWTEQKTRHYADGRATAAVLGYIDPRYGRTGVEGAWNLEMSGLSRTFTARDLHRILTGDPPGGNDLTLTLDLGLQQAAQAALADHRGAIAVLDPDTGGILALATNPTFDPASIRTDFPALASSDEGALRNRATQDLYPPGSSMKVVVTSAALMHNFDPTTRYTCPGTSHIYQVTVTDFHGEHHGSIDMPQALAVSCNNYFARAAVAIGGEKFNRPWWKALPDARMLPLPLAESTIVPDITAHIPDGELAHMGFGQSTVVASPLQMAMVAAAVANHGTLMAPFLVKELRKSGGGPSLATFNSVPIGFPLSADAADRVATMMRGVVTHGTGTHANLPNLTVYGKTGTAQQSGGMDHAWFIGFATREHAGVTGRIAFAALIERGGTGGVVAVPAARKVLEAWGEEE